MRQQKPLRSRVIWGVAVVGLTVLTVGSLQSAPRTGAASPSVDAWQVPEVVTSPTADLSPSEWSGIRQAYDRHRHQVVPVAGQHDVWQARNPAQQWVTRFDARGFLVEPSDGAWTWGLELTGYGIQGSEAAVATTADVRVDGARVTYARGADVDEWFVNDGRGLEHGFTLRARPAVGVGSVALEFGVRGGLQPRIHADRRGVAFVDTEQTPVITYEGLTVVDAEGRAVPAWFEPAGAALRLVVRDTGAQYPLTIDPLAQQAYLKASNTDVSDNFGFSVAVSEDTVVIGAVGEDSNSTGVDGPQSNNSASAAGAAYVFVRSGSGWSQQAYLKASNTGGSDGFGWSVAVSGDTVVVGALTEDSSSTGVDGPQSDNSASAAGAAYVFVRNGGGWSQQAYLKASNTGSDDWFGWSVAVSGDTAVVGAYRERSGETGVDGTQSDNSAQGAGAAYVFVRNGSGWSQQAYLKASNTDVSDNFGFSVAVSEDTVVIGAVGEDSNSTGVDGPQSNNSASAAGAAYVFVRNGGGWSQQAYLKASNTGGSDGFGWSVAVSGDTVVVGALTEDSSSTGVDGPQSDNSASAAGAAYVFVRNGGGWSQQAYLKASNTGSDDRFGASVAVSGDTAVVGAYREQSGETGVDGNQSDNSASDAGATYVFELEPNNQAPIADAGPNQPDAECTGQSTAGCVTVTLDGTGSSDPDGDTLTYTWEPGRLGGSSPTPILPLGTHEFTLEVDDANGGTDTDTVTVTVVDTIAPSLTVPADITQVAASPLGDAIAFTATATDAGDASPVVTCTPASGATFPLGTTTVECTAEDLSGNISAPSSLDVTLVLGDETFDGFTGKIKTMGLEKGLENALIAKVNAAKRSLGKGNLKAALGSLKALLNQISAQAGKKLTAGQAAELTWCVDALVAALS